MSDAVGLAEMLDVVGYNYQESRYAADHERYPEAGHLRQREQPSVGQLGHRARQRVCRRPVPLDRHRLPGRGGRVSQPRQRRRPARSVRVQEAHGVVPAEPVERRADGLPRCGVAPSPAMAPAGRVLPHPVAGRASRSTGTGRQGQRSRSRATRTARTSRSRSTINRSASSRSPVPSMACCAGTCRISRACSRLSVA